MACPRTTEAAAKNEKMTPPSIDDLRTVDLRRCCCEVAKGMLCEKSLLGATGKSSEAGARATAPQARSDDVGARSRSRDSADPWGSRRGYEPPARASTDEWRRAFGAPRTRANAAQRRGCPGPTQTVP